MTNEIKLPEDCHRFDYSVLDRAYMTVSASKEHDYRMGSVKSPDGIVAVYDQCRFSGSQPYTSLDFVWQGRCYSVSWQRTFTDRFLVTLARRFAASIVSQH